MTLFKRTLLIIGIAVNLVPLTSSPSLGESRHFFCGSMEGKYTTFVRTSKEIVPLFYWTSGYFAASGWTDKKRCIEVSRRFQTYYNGGKLEYIRTGTVNHYPVLCVNRCLDAEVLITLKSGENPEDTLIELLNLRNRSRSTPIELSDNQTFTYDKDGEMYVNLDKLIQSLPPVSEGDITPVATESPNTNSLNNYHRCFSRNPC